MPIYEGDRDRENEGHVAWILEYIGYEVETTQTLAPYDFLIKYNGKPHAIAEFKARSESHRRWIERGGLNIDKAKIDDLIDAAFEMGVKPMLFYWIEAPPIFHVTLHKSFQTTVMERKDRPGETPDVCYVIPHVPGNTL